MAAPVRRMKSQVGSCESLGRGDALLTSAIKREITGDANAQKKQRIDQEANRSNAVAMLLVSWKLLLRLPLLPLLLWCAVRVCQPCCFGSVGSFLL